MQYILITWQSQRNSQSYWDKLCMILDSNKDTLTHGSMWIKKKRGKYINQRLPNEYVSVKNRKYEWILYELPNCTYYLS